MACRSVNMRQYQHWCACVTPSISAYETQHAPSTLEHETWSYCRLRCSSSKLSVLLRISNVSDTQHQKKKIHRSHYLLDDHNKKSCVCEQLGTRRPLIHLCDHDVSHFSMSHWAPLQLSSVSVPATCRTAPSTWPNTQFVERIALTWLPNASKTPPSPCPWS